MKEKTKKLQVYIPKTIDAALRAKAKAEGRTLSGQVEMALRESVANGLKPAASGQ